MTTTFDAPSESIVRFPAPDFVDTVFPSTTTLPRVETPVTIILSNSPVPKSNCAMVPTPVILRLVACIP